MSEEAKKGQENGNENNGLDNDTPANGSEDAGAGEGKGKDQKTPQDANTGDESGQKGEEKPGDGKEDESGTDNKSDGEETPKDDNESDTQEWPEYEDKNMAAITNIFKEKGVDIDVADGIFQKAIESGNIEDVDVETLKESVGEDAATLIMGAVTTVYSQNVKLVKDVVKFAHDEFGGKDGWEAAKDWALTKAAEDSDFKEQLGEYYEMIDAGGKKSELAIKALKEDYMADDSTTDKPNLTRGDGSGKTNEKPITNRVEYVNKLKEAHANGDEARIAELKRRRAAGRKSDNRFGNGSW